MPFEQRKSVQTVEGRPAHWEQSNRSTHDTQDNSALMRQHLNYLAASGISAANTEGNGMDRVEEVRFLLQMNQQLNQNSERMRGLKQDKQRTSREKLKSDPAASPEEVPSRGPKSGAAKNKKLKEHIEELNY